MESEADTGDTATGDFVDGMGLPVFVGHLGVDDFLWTSGTDADDYERHFGDTEMALSAFP